MYGFIIKYVPYVRLILTLGVTQPPRDVLLELESQFLIGDAMGEAALPRLLETYSKTAPSPDTWMGGWEVEECPCVAIFIPSFFLAATVWCKQLNSPICCAESGLISHCGTGTGTLCYCRFLSFLREGVRFF